MCWPLLGRGNENGKLDLYVYGKAVSLAARVKRGQCIMEMQVKKEHLEAAKKALKSACVKLPGTPTIRVIPLN